METVLKPLGYGHIPLVYGHIPLVYGHILIHLTRL